MNVIRIENLSKKYMILRGDRDNYDTLKAALIRMARRFSGKGELGPNRERRKEFWALSDVSLDIQQGEVVGVIGKNGAGKSTLLKVLARITEPTAGRVRIRGRVSSLLEVGTGFHPELTGLENIYLNASILGMTRSRIKDTIERIIDFSETGEFMNTPVKRYSSGMYVRLAFSVAAHMNPDILLLDEVLTVGDVAFQKKCLDKIREIANSGRTILFVSHRMEAVLNLCTRCFVLREGRILFDGATSKAVEHYLSALKTAAETDLANRTDRSGSGDFRFVRITFEKPDGNPAHPRTGEDLCVCLHYRCRPEILPDIVSVGMAFMGTHGQMVTHMSTHVRGVRLRIESETGVIRCSAPRLPLTAGTYGITLFSAIGAVHADKIEEAARFEVAVGDFYGSGKITPGNHTVVLMDHEWSISENSGEVSS